MYKHMEQQLNLYLISQSENNDYDTYDSAVVVAESEEQARRIYPGNDPMWDEGMSSDDSWMWSHCWATPDNVRVLFLGPCQVPEAKVGTVICASFRAG